MNTTRMITIARELGLLYTAQRSAEIALAHQREDLDARRVALAPADGWPGKNEEQRKIAAGCAYAADETIRTIAGAIVAGEKTLATLAGQIAALEAERRALEWAIRGELVQALAGRRIEPESRGPVEEAAFDAAADAQVIEQALAVPDEPLYALDDDFPF